MTNNSDQINDLRVGIIGYGFATKTFHAPVVLATPGLQLTAISSSDAKKVEADFRDSDKLTICNSPDELINLKELDIVVVPTPNQSHYPLAKKALEAGKHVVVDKPFTITSKEAEELAALADAKKLTLSVFHNRRFDSDFLTVAKLLNENKLGRVVHFESHFDRFRPEVVDRWRESNDPGAGIWYDLGAHLLDQTVQLFGKPQSIQLSKMVARDKGRSTDFFHAILQYKAADQDQNKSMLAVLHASTLSAIAGPRYSIHGTNGSYIKFGLDPQEDALKAGGKPGSKDWGKDDEDGTLSMLDNGTLRESVLPTEAGNYVEYYAKFRDSVLRQAPNPVTAGQAAFIIKLIELGEQSALEQRAVLI